VHVRIETLVLPTYLPHQPDPNPMFLEKRVYQGSSGRVYPLPFTDRIAEKPVPRKWKALWIENQFLSVLVLPEIGGRIHAIQDKTNGCDLIYNQKVGPAQHANLDAAISLRVLDNEGKRGAPTLLMGVAASFSPMAPTPIGTSSPPCCRPVTAR
jgi:hypothetical protein